MSDIEDAEEALLSIRDLRTHYHTLKGDVKAVDGIDLDIERGETLGLVGESGCGKSTVALSILDLIPSPGEVVEGEVRLEGRDILSLTDEEKRAVRGNDITITYQDALTSLNPVKKTGDQIDEQQLAHRDASRKEVRQNTLDVLSDVNIQNPQRFAESYPHELSGGMSQRGLISMALSMDPKLLIADEPTTALDVTTQATVLEILKDLKREQNMSILLITHDLGVIAEMADRVAVMYAGKAVEVGDVDTIFNRPSHPYTKLLLEAVPDPEKEGELQDISGSVPNLVTPPSGCRFHPRCPYATEECKQNEPPLENIEDGHRVACFHQDDVRQESIQ